MANLHYYKLSLQLTLNAYNYQQKESEFLICTYHHCLCTNPTQVVYNTEQYKFAQVILVMTNACICEWLLTVAETTSKPHCFLPTQDTTV